MTPVKRVNKIQSSVRKKRKERDRREDSEGEMEREAEEMDMKAESKYFFIKMLYAKSIFNHGS